MCVGEKIRKCPYLICIFYATKVKNIHGPSFSRAFKSAKTRETPCTVYIETQGRTETYVLI